MAEVVHQEVAPEEAIEDEATQKDVPTEVLIEIVLIKIKANVEEDNVFFKA